MAFVLVSCNQKNKEATTEHSHTMGDTTMMDNDTIMMNDKTKTMENTRMTYKLTNLSTRNRKISAKLEKLRIHTIYYRVLIIS